MKQSSLKFIKGNLYKMATADGEISKGYFVAEIRSSFLNNFGDSSAFSIFRVKGTGTKNPVYVGGPVFVNDGIEYIDDEIQGLAVAAAPGIFDDDFAEFLCNADDSIGKYVGISTSQTSKASDTDVIGKRFDGVEFEPNEKYKALYRGQKVELTCKGYFVDETLSSKRKYAVFVKPGYEKAIFAPLNIARVEGCEKRDTGEYVNDDNIKLKVAAAKGIFDEDFNLIGKAVKKRTGVDD